MKSHEKRSITEVQHQRGLVIGLGGTGAEVLAGNRRKVIEQFRSMENVPMIRYLYVDTNPQWWESYQSRVEKSVALSEKEFCDIQVKDMSVLYQGIKRKNFPHYEWFDLQKLESVTCVVEGAGTVRQMARLAFWHHYNEIREALVDQINALRKDSVATYMLNHHGIQLDPGINVYIVAGLAGGTGSGLWLDMAYLVRKILKEMGIAGANQILGYGVLPQAFKDLSGANPLANGYAALKELNYYSYMYSSTNQLAPIFGEPVWDADYKHDSSNRVSFKRVPPFDFCYLLDARNAEVDLNRKDVFHMIDNAIFQEFTGSFGPFKRALRANIKGKMISNDRTDCPIRFMSFGQASAQVPMPEIKQVLAHQLALQAVQQWIDKKAKPIKALVVGNGGTEENLTESVVGSIKQKAMEPTLVSNVRGWLRSNFMKAHGLNQAGVFAAVVMQQQERVTDIPYALVEAVKSEWITQNWPYDMFVGRVKNAWEKWRIDFNDESSDRMHWGERIGKLEANKTVASKTYKNLIREEAFRMFEDSEHFGPAWAVCALQQLKAGLGQLKQRLIDEAGSANVIANALGDVYIIDAVTGNRGPSLSAIIEAKTSKDLDVLNAEVKNWRFGGKRKAVCDAAYQYLQDCAHWCRAKVEERARREAAELLDQVVQYLGAMEEELIGHATILASLEGELVKQTRAWNQKAIQTQNVGAVLYDSGVLGRLETKLREMRGDQYSASVVAQKTLKGIGGNLRDLKQGQVAVLLAKLVEAGLEAVGDLAETGLEDTDFAAHDLLSAAYETNGLLDSTLKGVIEKSSPYVRLSREVADGGWSASDLKPFEAAGLRGGGKKENDPDKDHARVVESLARNGWDVLDATKAVEDGSEIMLFQEVGNFPLRALQGVQEMKEAYDEHRSQPNKTPLHISRDEIAECYPDLFPPESNELERARVVQTVAIPLGFISQRDFPSLNGNGTPNRRYAFLRHIAELGEEQPIPLGKTVEAVGMKLADNPALLTEIEGTMDTVIIKAAGAYKAKFADQLRQYLTQRKTALKAESPNIDVENTPAYQAERDRIVAFMKKYELTNSAAGTAACETQQEAKMTAASLAI